MSRSESLFEHIHFLALLCTDVHTETYSHYQRHVLCLSWGVIKMGLRVSRITSVSVQRLFVLSLQADERRAPLRTWANACGPIDRWQPVEVDESRMAPVKMETERRWVRFCLCSSPSPNTCYSVSLMLALVLTSIHIVLIFHDD